MRAKDYFGNEICEGDWIVYPCRAGSEVWTQDARVVSVERDRILVEGGRPRPWERRRKEMGRRYVRVFDQVVDLNAFARSRFPVVVPTVWCSPGPSGDLKIEATSNSGSFGLVQAPFSFYVSGSSR